MEEGCGAGLVGAGGGGEEELDAFEAVGGELGGHWLCKLRLRVVGRRWRRRMVWTFCTGCRE